MIDNLDLMRMRLETQGGIAQEDRMIKDKYKTFLKTLKYSYQGCDVILAQPYSECLPDDSTLPTVRPQYRALINPDKTKQDYDDKILSIDYATGYGPGDVFKWINTDTHWIIYLQALTEDAYFRGELRLCRHKIKFRDSQGNFKATWAAIRGPVETQIQSIQKNQIRVDQPNFSLNILVPRNEETLKLFDRYAEFMFADKCWRVEAVDSISMKNIIEVNAEEYYIDRDTDTQDVKDGLVIEPQSPSPDTKIIGETFIKPNIEELYQSPEPGGKWCIIPKDAPVLISKYKSDTIRVKWQKMISGQFELQWSDGDQTETKTIIVESLL